MTRPIEIIAEIGINHNGEFDCAKDMILRARQCGADVAKFQVYDPETVLDREHPDIKPWWDLILQTQFTQAQWRELAAYCDEVGIEFFCSVFDMDDVDWLNPLVKRWKIASRSMYDELLAFALAGTGKPVIVSYGHFDGRVAAIHGWSLDTRKLYCVSKYPTELTDLRFLRSGHSIFPMLFAGFSDHTEGTLAARVAMAMGAEIIEKHFTFDRFDDGPDHRCSADSVELAGLCYERDRIEELLYREKSCQS
jgi:sialic acid synthase SpsE